MAQFKKGQSGNPAGKPKGAQNWHSKVRQQIEAVVPDLIENLIELAKAGDVQALKLLLDKVLPNIKPQAAAISLPLTATDEVGRAREVFQAMVQGELSPDQSTELIGSLLAIVKVKEFADIEQRIMTLEELVTGSKS